MAQPAAASILVAPTTGYHFNNTQLGDLLIRGLNGGLTQKILLGTQSNMDAAMSIEPSLVKLATSLALSNAYGQQTIYTSNDFVGIGTAAPMGTLDVAGSLAINNVPVIDAARNVSNVKALTLDGPVTMRSAAGSARLAFSGSNMTINTHLQPTGNEQFDLGASNARFRDIYLSGNTIHLGSNILTTRDDGAVVVKVTRDSEVTYEPAPMVVSTLTAVAEASNASGVKYAKRFVTRSNDGALLTVAYTMDSNGVFTETPGTASMMSAFYADPATGYVGINTTTPQAWLDVAGPAVFGGQITLSNADGAPALYGASSNVGINTASPTVALDVTGDIHATGAAAIDGALAVQGAAEAFGDLTVRSNATVWGELRTSNNAYFSSNLTVLGSLNATTVNYAYSNVTVYTSQEVRSNLTVDGTLSASNDLVVQGAAVLSNTAVVYGAASFSNAVSAASTLTVLGAAALSNTTDVYGVASFSNAVFLASGLTAEGAAALTGTLDVTGATTLSNTVGISGALALEGAATLSNTVAVYGYASFSNAVWMDSNLFVRGAAALAAGLDVAGATTLSNSVAIVGPLDVEGATTLYGAAALSNGVTVAGDATLADALTVYGATTLSNAVTAASDLTVAGDAGVGGALAVTGAATLSNALNVLGATALGGTLSVAGVTSLSNDLFATGSVSAAGAASFGGALSVQGTASFSNPVFAASNLTVLGAALLSNAVDVYGLETTHAGLVLAGSNAATSNVLDALGSVYVSGGLKVDGPLTLSQAINASNDFAVTGVTTLGSNLYVAGDTVLSGKLNTSNDAVFASNLTVLGSLNATTVNYAYSNVTIYTSTIYRSNLSIDGDILASNALTALGAASFGSTLQVTGIASFSNAAGFAGDVAVLGAAAFSNAVTIDGALTGTGDAAFGGALTAAGPATMSNALDVYGAFTVHDNTVALSNSTGAAVLSASNSFLGLDMPVGVSPAYTLDVNGDINLTGRIFQNGAVYSGWNSNAFGNYINSNAAFKGESTATDGLLLYTYAGTDDTQNLAFSLSNASGKVTMYSLSNQLGVGTNAPGAALDVAGAAHTSAGLFVDSNAAWFQSVLPGARLGVIGDAVIEGAATVSSNLGIGTHAPAFPVDVQANVSGVSINCSAKVVATEFSIFSDRRIKTDVVTRDPNEYLSAVNAIPVREYAYLDGFEKGRGHRIGFIAQEVEAVMPNCVQTVSEYVPNIYRALPVARADAAAKTATLRTTDLPAEVRDALLLPGKAVKVRTAQDSGSAALATIRGVDADAGEVTLEFQGWVPAPDAAGGLFVVGTRIDDFKMLNQERISCMAIGAIQAQHARIQALEAALEALAIRGPAW